MPATSLTSPKPDLGTTSQGVLSPKEGQTEMDHLLTDVPETASLQPSPPNLMKDFIWE